MQQADAINNVPQSEKIMRTAGGVGVCTQL